MRLLSAIFLLNFAFAIPVAAMSQMAASNCSGQLTIISRHEGNSELYLLTSGNSLINITNNREANVYDPIWSPDGKYLVFTAHRLEGRTRLQLLDMDTNNAITLADAHNAAGRFYAEWAPNGQQIAFVTQEGELVVADTNGAVKRIVNANFRLQTPVTWSPDGNYVAFSSQVFENSPTLGETWDISTVNVRTGEIEVLSSVEFSFDEYVDPRKPGWLYWMPDNKHLIITREHPGRPPKYAVEVLDLETRILRRVADRIVWLGPPSLDNISFLYSTGSDLDLLNLNTGTVRNLTNYLDDSVILQALSPSTRTIAFNTKKSLNRIFLMDAERNISLHITDELPMIIDSIIWRPAKCP